MKENSDNMKEIISVVGTRPQIIKSAALSRAFSKSSSLQETVIHTRQHYTANMSSDLFMDLGIPIPTIELDLPSDSSPSYGQMYAAIHGIIQERRPSAVIVYGDTTSTLAGARAASDLKIPLVHIEAGLRSFNMEMPEEYNRIETDKISQLHFCPTNTAASNLIREGMESTRVIRCGDIMYDNAMHYGKQVEPMDLPDYAFLTLHRPSNVDDSERLFEFLSGLVATADQIGLKLLFPIHHRTKQSLEKLESWSLFSKNDTLILSDPLTYTDTLRALKGCKQVWTDSGGLSKEAYFLARPCLILRSETEWVELVENGYARIVHNDLEKIAEAATYFSTHSLGELLPLYGDGSSADLIVKTLEDFLA
jgi:UDP-GlcNAc3NAcA epimerase